MTKIKFDTKMHRTSCLHLTGNESSDAETYDANIEAYWNYLRGQLAERGFDLDLGWKSHGPDYMVSMTGDFSAEKEAEEFMQFECKGFWEWYN